VGLARGRDLGRDAHQVRLFHEDAAADNGDSDRHLERYIEMLDRGGRDYCCGVGGLVLGMRS
jgi:hypothetical protein